MNFELAISPLTLVVNGPTLAPLGGVGWLVMTEILLAILSLICVIVFFYGIFLLLFRKGRRWRGLGLTVGAFFAVGVILGVADGVGPNRDARKAGFESAADQKDAATAGFTDAALWAAERERRRVAEAERLAAEREAEEARQAEEAAAEKEAARFAEAERVRKGFHCLSSWDGSHSALKNAVKTAMRDPDSFEHIETRITPMDDDGDHLLWMKYRARNGFGGMNVSETKALIKNDGCGFQVIAIE